MTELKKVRIQKGLQRTFVAESCGLKQYNLGRYENNGIKTVDDLKSLFEIK